MEGPCLAYRYHNTMALQRLQVSQYKAIPILQVTQYSDPTNTTGAISKAPYLLYMCHNTMTQLRLQVSQYILAILMFRWLSDDARVFEETAKFLGIKLDLNDAEKVEKNRQTISNCNSYIREILDMKYHDLVC